MMSARRDPRMCSRTGLRPPEPWQSASHGRALTRERRWHSPLVALALFACLAPGSSGPLVDISAAEAKEHVGEAATVWASLRARSTRSPRVVSQRS